MMMLRATPLDAPPVAGDALPSIFAFIGAAAFDDATRPYGHHTCSTSVTRVSALFSLIVFDGASRVRDELFMAARCCYTAIMLRCR